MTTRSEHDTMGSIKVESNKLWGAQTQRSLLHFNISTERMPGEMIKALALVKGVCANVNCELGLLPELMAVAISKATDEIQSGLHDDEFPLSVWQTGSCTQTNMNMNEVLANRASELLGGERGENRLIHPNDHVNLGQSSNDIIPTAMHVATCLGVVKDLMPAINILIQSLNNKSQAFNSIVKIGLTHLQDATPLTLGQEFSGYVDQLDHAFFVLNGALPSIYPLAVGATAVGTGLNTHKEFGERVAARLAKVTGLPFISAVNKFSALSAHDGLVFVHGAIKTLSVALMKITSDIRWLSSGPRCGLGEISIPENEPGSSMMPGKVNPTQCEALSMVCCQVMGNDVAITFGGSLGNFELNVYKPLLIHNLMQSIRMLSGSLLHFETYCARGIEANPRRINDLLNQSLMLVTALVPSIGYDRAAAMANYAQENGSSLEEAANILEGMTGDVFSRLVRPLEMTNSKGLFTLD